MFALIAVLVASASVTSSDAGVAPDAPTVIKLSDGSGYLFSKPAFDAVNLEMKRLQEVEKQSKVAKENQPWVQVVLISAAVGLAVGLGSGVALGLLLPKPNQKTP